MTTRTTAEIADALDGQDGYTLFCQWADAIDLDKHAQAWDELSSWDRGEWHRRALPFSQLAEVAASRLRADAARIEELERALKPFAAWADDWPEMGDTRMACPIDSDPDPHNATVGDLRAARRAHGGEG